jgi:hypothetical protein
MTGMQIADIIALLIMAAGFAGAAIKHDRKPKETHITLVKIKDGHYETREKKIK